MLIGVPVAATPAFGPHDEVSDDPPLELELAPLDVDVALLELPPLAAALLELVLLLLLPQAATRTAAMTAASMKLRRTRSVR
jgi:hypothetical protein